MYIIYCCAGGQLLPIKQKVKSIKPIKYGI